MNKAKNYLLSTVCCICVLLIVSCNDSKDNTYVNIPGYTEGRLGTSFVKTALGFSIISSSILQELSPGDCVIASFTIGDAREGDHYLANNFSAKKLNKYDLYDVAVDSSYVGHPITDLSLHSYSSDNYFADHYFFALETEVPTGETLIPEFYVDLSSISSNFNPQTDNIVIDIRLRPISGVVSGGITEKSSMLAVSLQEIRSLFTRLGGYQGANIPIAFRYYINETTTRIYPSSMVNMLIY